MTDKLSLNGVGGVSKRRPTYEELTAEVTRLTSENASLQTSIESLLDGYDEGMTPADVVKLRNANTVLAMESHDLQGKVAELVAKVERLRSILIDKTAEPTCCGLGVGDPQSGFSCCGNPEFSWPDDVVEVLIETTSSDGSVNAQYAIKGEGE